MYDRNQCRYETSLICKVLRFLLIFWSFFSYTPAYCLKFVGAILIADFIRILLKLVQRNGNGSRRERWDKRIGVNRLCDDENAEKLFDVNFRGNKTVLRKFFEKDVTTCNGLMVMAPARFKYSFNVLPNTIFTFD